MATRFVTSSLRAGGTAWRSRWCTAHTLTRVHTRTRTRTRTHTRTRLYTTHTSGSSEDGDLQVPVVDVGALRRSASLCSTVRGERDALTLHNATENEATVARQIHAACSEWGFFQVVNHGVDKQLMTEFYEQQAALFSMERDVKLSFKRTESNSKGWYDDEFTKQRLDWKQGFDFGAQDGSLDTKGLDGWNQWPSRDSLPHFEGTMRRYFSEMEELSRILIAGMALGLGLPSSYFESAFERHSSYLRLNYYPRCPDPDSHKAISHHTDAGGVTVLTQSDVQSLQVWKGNTHRGHPVEGEGRWYDVPPTKDAFVINTGDIMQVWSNDVYTAPLHQVKAQENLERYSAPFFYNPSYDTNYEPVPSCVSDETPARYRPINWGTFRLGRFAGDYADVGEETQISHYRI
eukprot:GFYU01025609.1.p1 GENE.GFYU01025609.1~~GFYU01025609.1.p1  ORF type:complete len:415 (-),score=102.03 GFYU01025609.1:92-1303(-)